MRLSLAVCTLAALLLTAQAVFVPGTGGYVTIDEENDSNIFYWLFKSAADPSTAPLTLWLTGGPGCSSALAALSENGPYLANSDSTLVPNKWGWAAEFVGSNMIYVDQPIGTGFSYTKGPYVHNETQVADDMYTFLQGFLKGPGKEFQGRAFYITGESYGGHYTASVSARIVRGNLDLQPGDVHIPLMGVECGNGMVSAEAQFPSYLQFIEYVGLTEPGSEVSKQVAEQTDKCLTLLANGEYDEGYEVCLPIIEMVVEPFANATCPNSYNVYDYTICCEIPGLCYNFTGPTDYLNNPAVKEALGVPESITYETCNDAVNAAFTYDWVAPFTNDLAFVLDNGVPVTLIDGQLDMICNWIGELEDTASIEWTGQLAWLNAEWEDWYIGSEYAGLVKRGKGFLGNELTFIAVSNAGHLVPHDQPEPAAYIMRYFLYGDALNTTAATNPPNFPNFSG